MQHWQIFKNLQDRHFMKFSAVPNSDQSNNFRIPFTGEDLTFLFILFWSLFWIKKLTLLCFWWLDLVFFQVGLVQGTVLWKFKFSFLIWDLLYKIKVVFFQYFWELDGFCLKILLWNVVGLCQLLILKMFQTFWLQLIKKTYMSTVWLSF